MNGDRRKVLGTALALGGMAALPAHRVLASALTPTPAQTMGPFYPVTRPLDADADLTLVQGRTGSADGEIIHLVGRVLDRSGAPVRNARIEIWQANSRGRYAHPADVNPAPLDANFQGYGIQTTDADGQYRFKTIKPAGYPIGRMNPAAMRTPHIHFDVSGGEARLVTQMYFPGEAQNERDRIFRQFRPDQRIAATATKLPPTSDLEPDSLLLRWDIVLAGR